MVQNPADALWNYVIVMLLPNKKMLSGKTKTIWCILVHILDLVFRPRSQQFPIGEK